MFCSNCGAQMPEEAKFCGECGQPTSGETNGGAASATSYGESSGAGSTAQSLAENEYVQKGKAVSKHYFSVYKRQLKAPFFEARQMAEGSMVNGMISIVLFSLAIGLTIYFNVQGAAGEFMDIPFFSTVANVFIAWIILFLLVAGVFFITFKIMRSEVSFGNLINRMGSLLALPMTASLAAMLTGLIQLGFLSSLFLLIAVSTSTLAIFSVIFSVERKTDKAIDPFYGVIIAGIGTSIVIFIVFVTILGSLINDFQNLMMF